MPKSWEDRLSIYCTYLIAIKQLKSQTVKSYISGIKHVLITDGYDWNDGKVILNTLTKSCKIKNDKLKVRLPIQKVYWNLYYSKYRGNTTTNHI